MVFVTWLICGPGFWSRDWILIMWSVLITWPIIGHAIGFLGHVTKNKSRDIFGSRDWFMVTWLVIGHVTGYLWRGLFFGHVTEWRSRDRLFVTSSVFDYVTDLFVTWLNLGYVTYFGHVKVFYHVADLWLGDWLLVTWSVAIWLIFGHLTEFWSRDLFDHVSVYVFVWLMYMRLYVCLYVCEWLLYVCLCMYAQVPLASTDVCLRKGLWLRRLSVCPSA